MSFVAAAAVIVSGVFNYRATRKAGRAQRELAERNAQIGESRARDAEERGVELEQRHRITTNRLAGQQRAAFAASGVDISDLDATPQNVIDDTYELSELDAINIRKNAAREAWGYRMGVQDDLARGQLADAEARNQALGGALSTGSGLLYQQYFGSNRTRQPNAGS